MVLLLESHDHIHFSPISYTRFLWDITLGVMTPLERAKREFGEVKCWSPRFREDGYRAFVSEEWVWKGEEVFLVLNPQFVYPVGFRFEKGLGITPDGRWVYVAVSERISEEILLALEGQNVNYLASLFPTREISEGIYYRDVADVVNRLETAVEMFEPYFATDEAYISPQERVYIHKTAVIDPYVVWHPEKGMIVVDKGAKVRAFSIVDGPSYIGEKSLVDSGRLREGTVIRNSCKIGGEVEWSVIESYSNKHHEGFLGHSYVGSWVNIGAMATTSDLKNNYRPIVIERREGKLETRTNKFGSVIADFVKIGIGVMLNTGTVIEPGANIFLEGGFVQPPKYVKAFSWGRSSFYEWEKFWRDLTTMMRRREVTPPPSFRAFLQSLYEKLTL
ncbi:Glucose-1-phosphate thymidylyltransferase [Brevinematales bacterium NS]|nr:Glucose-1-phosphate thymidylyltransferase [Brevinematales bacterium NS]